MKTRKVDILLPCYNEEKTIKECIKRIKKVISNEKDEYRIVVCDNNSTDSSVKIAKSQNVKVLIEKEKGYGATLINGIVNSRADYIVILDSDLSYNEKDIPLMVSMLDNYDLVIGNRFKGNIQKSAMPISHRYGSRLLTEIANIFFKTSSHDFHCGLRAFKRKEILKCDLTSKGFEFASEMIIRAKLNNLKIKEVPTDLFVDGRDGKSNLNTIKDGFRHLFLINKIKFQSSSFFRYLSLYLILIVIFFSSLIITSLIPRRLIRNNTLESLDFFEKYSLDVNKNKYDFLLLEKNGDVRNISMAYNMDPHHPFDSAIRMSYQKKLDDLINLRDTFENNYGDKVNYSRYWQGQAMYSKVMLMFMPVGYLFYSLQLIVLTFFFLMTTIKLWKKDKILSLSFIIMNVSINALFTAFSVQYFFAILLMYIFSLMIIKMYENNNKYIDLMFAISGSLTCFFDFLTCETIVLTVPLFIYIYFSIKDKKTINIKEVLKYVIIWGLFYSLTFLSKWLIDIMYFGKDYLFVILNKAMIRVEYVGISKTIIVCKAILLSLGNLLPFAFLKKSIVLPIILFLISLHILLFDYKKYWLLIIPVIIPFLRMLVLSSHSFSFNYFVYRSLGVLVLFFSVLIIHKIVLILKVCYN